MGEGQPPDIGDTAGIKIDVHDGTFQQLGVNNLFRSLAVRRGMVHADLLEGDESDISTTITFALGDTPTHPFDTGLPRAQIRAWKFGGHGYFDITYQHLRSSLPPQDAAVIAEFHSAYDHVEVFRRPSFATAAPGGGVTLTPTPHVDGLPNGDINFARDDFGFTDPDNEPIGWYYKRPTLKILVPTVLTDSPYNQLAPAIAGLVGKVNSDTITFNGVALPGAFDPGSVRFDAAHVSWEQGGGGLGQDIYRVLYEFTATTKWVTQSRAYLEAVWRVYNEPMYDAAEFAGAFPVHTP